MNVRYGDHGRTGQEQHRNQWDGTVKEEVEEMKKSLILTMLIVGAVMFVVPYGSYASGTKGSISPKEAEGIALGEVPGEVLKMEYENGRYAVRIRTEVSELAGVYIDAESGEVMKVKTESCEEDDD